MHCALPCSRYRDTRESRESQPESLQLHLETRFEQLRVGRGVVGWRTLQLFSYAYGSCLSSRLIAIS